MSFFYKEVSRRIQQETPQFSTGAKLVDSLVNSLEKQGLLPKKLPEQATPNLAEQPRDLRAETYNLLGDLREPTAGEREAFCKKDTFS